MLKSTWSAALDRSLGASRYTGFPKSLQNIKERLPWSQKGEKWALPFSACLCQMFKGSRSRPLLVRDKAFSSARSDYIRHKSFWMNPPAEHEEQREWLPEGRGRERLKKREREEREKRQKATDEKNRDVNCCSRSILNVFSYSKLFISDV